MEAKRQGENGSTEPITKTSRVKRLDDFRVRGTRETEAATNSLVW